MVLESREDSISGGTFWSFYVAIAPAGEVQREKCNNISCVCVSDIKHLHYSAQILGSIPLIIPPIPSNPFSVPSETKTESFEKKRLITLFSRSGTFLKKFSVTKLLTNYYSVMVFKYIL